MVDGRIRPEIIAILSFIFAIAFALYGLYQLTIPLINYGSVFVTTILAFSFMVSGFIWNPKILIKKK